MESASSSSSPPPPQRSPRGHVWKPAHLALPLDRSSAPLQTTTPAATPASHLEPPRSPKSWSSPSSPTHSPRPKEKAVFSLGKNRSIRPSADAIREAVMSSSDGVEVCDHKLKLRVFSQCFSASASLDWLQTRFDFARDEALEFCQQLLDDGWMKSASGSSSRFTDSSEELFQWCSERISSSSSSSASSLSAVASSPQRSIPIFSRGGSRLRASAGHDNHEDGPVMMSSSMPSLQRKKPSLQMLTFGAEPDKSFKLLEPSFSCKVSDNPLQVAKALQSCPLRNLRSLSLRGLELAGDVFLLCMGPNLKQMRSLAKLDISENDLGFSFIRQLLENVDVSQLSDLRLQNVGLNSGTADESEFWTLLCSGMKLNVLDVSGNELTDGTIPILGKELSGNRSLHTLFLDETSISPSGQVVLVQTLLWNSSLKTLSMTSMKSAVKTKARVSPRDFTPQSLSRLPSELSIAALKSRTVESKKHEFLSYLQQNVSLTSLSIDASMIEGQNAVLILNRVLSQNGFICSQLRGEFSCREWKSVPSLVCAFQHLKELDLSCNNLCELPWSLLRLQNLEVLDVSRNLITASAFPVHVSFFPRLRSLNVSENPLVQSFPSSLNWRNTNELLRYFNQQCSQGIEYLYFIHYYCYSFSKALLRVTRCAP